MFYEFTHDSLANAVYEKVSVEEKARRKVERFVKDRHVYYVSQGVLLNQKDLEYIQPYLDRINLTDEEWEFVRKSRVNSRNRRLRLVAIVVAMLLISSLAIIALFQRSRAEAARELAEKNRVEAVANAKRASENEQEAIKQANLAEQNANRANLKALEAREAEAEADRQKLLAVAAAEEAEQKRRLAEDLAKDLSVSRQVALDAAKKEKEARERAEELQKKEQIARGLADSLKDLALAQSVALKSLQIENQEERALVAQKAYFIHQERNGNPFDPNLYQALYFAQPKPSILRGGHKGRVRGLTQRPELGEFLISVGSDGQVNRWPYRINQTADPLFSSKDLSRAVAIGPNASLWIGTEDGRVHQIRLNDGELLQTYQWHNGPIWDLTWDQVNQRMFSSGGDGYLMSHVVDSMNADTLMAGQPTLKQLHLTFDGNLLAANDRGELYSISGLRGITVQKILTISHPITSLALSPDSKYLVLGDEKGRIRVWEWHNQKDLQNIATLVAHRARVTDLCFSHDGALFASCSWDQTARLWESPDFNARSILLSDHDNPAECLAFSLDGTELFVGLTDGKIKRWQTQPDSLFKKLRVNPDLDISWDKYLGTSTSTVSDP